MKKRQTKLVQHYLFNNQLDQFEHQLTSRYYKYSQRLFPLVDSYSYTDWLVDFSRRYSQEKIPSSFLLSSYLQNTIDYQHEEERFFHLLQFLSFTHNKITNSINIYSQIYYLIAFQLKEFMEFLQIKNKSLYQKNKLIDFFYCLTF